MKKKLFLLLICTLSFNVFSQNKVISDQIPLYQGIISVDGKSADDIHANLKSWVALNFGSAKDVMQLDDDTNKKLIIKGIAPFHYILLMTRIDSKCFYTITTEARDNRFKYTINITEIEVGSNHQSGMSEVMNKPKSRNSKGIIPNIERIMSNLIKGMEAQNFADDSSDEW